MTAVTIASPRQPDTVLLFSGFVLYGLAALAAFDRLGTRTLKSFPDPWGYFFVAALTIGAGLVLLAAWIDSVGAVVRFEWSGRLLLFVICAIYAAWNVKLTGLVSSAVSFTVVLSSLSASSAVRFVHIQRFRRAADRTRETP